MNGPNLIGLTLEWLEIRISSSCTAITVITTITKEALIDLVEWNSKYFGHENSQENENENEREHEKEKEKKLRVVLSEKSSLALSWEVVAMVKVKH
jgi:hypothetical protein